MERAAVDAYAGGAADDDGSGRVPEVVTLGDEVGELVEAAGDEIDELHFGDGAQAEIAHAAGGADDGAFADGRVNHALPAEFFEQAFAGFERASIDADVLPDEGDSGAVSHPFHPDLLAAFRHL